SRAACGSARRPCLFCFLGEGRLELMCAAYLKKTRAGLAAELTRTARLCKVRGLLGQTPPKSTCRGGGIGRRAGFRCQWGKLRGGSSPLLGTIFHPDGMVILSRLLKRNCGLGAWFFRTVRATVRSC